MFDKVLRPPKDRLLLGAARLTRRIPPVALTLSAFGCGLAAVAAVLLDATPLALALWLANRFLDGLDGAAARFQQRQSDLGGYLDQLLDTVIYALLPLALVASDPSQASYLSLALLLAAYYLNTVSWLYLAAILEKRRREPPTHLEKTHETTSIVMPSGLIEGTETVVFYSLFLLWPQQTVLLFSLFAALVLVSAAQRVFWAVLALRK